MSRRVENVKNRVVHIKGAICGIKKYLKDFLALTRPGFNVN